MNNKQISGEEMPMTLRRQLIYMCMLRYPNTHYYFRDHPEEAKVGGRANLGLQSRYPQE